VGHQRITKPIKHVSKIYGGGRPQLGPASAWTLTIIMRVRSIIIYFTDKELIKSTIEISEASAHADTNFVLGCLGQFGDTQRYTYHFQSLPALKLNILGAILTRYKCTRPIWLQCKSWRKFRVTQ